MKILYVFATRSRPQKCREALDSVINNSSSDNYDIILTIDQDDNSMRDFSYDKKELTFCKGTSTSKINAINRGMIEAKDYSVLIVLSDDMRFIKKGFDDDIRNAFISGYTTADSLPIIYDLDQLIHFPDQNQYANCMTMSIMGRTYYERFNYIYHPSYESLWCDLEAQEVGQILGKYKYMGDEARIFNHLHPSFGQAEYDEQYRKTEAMEVRSKDHQTYLTRKANNFYISSK